MQVALLVTIRRRSLRKWFAGLSPNVGAGPTISLVVDNKKCDFGIIVCEFLADILRGPSWGNGRGGVRAYSQAECHQH